MENSGLGKERNGKTRPSGEGMEDTKKKLAEELRIKAPIFKDFPDALMLRFLDGPHGVDEVYNIAKMSDSSREILKSLMLMRLRNVKVHACIACSVLFYNYIHFLLHVNDHHHKTVMIHRGTVIDYITWKETLEMFDDDIPNWKRADANFVDSLSVEEHALVSEKDESEFFCPTKEWLISMRIFTDVEDRGPNNDWMTRVLDELKSHLEGGTPLCAYCESVFTSSTDFMNHCLTYSHFEKVMNSKRAGATVTFQNITLILNDMNNDYDFTTTSEYFEHMEQSNIASDSAHICWQRVKRLMPYLSKEPKFRKRRTALDPAIELDLLNKCKQLLDGKHLCELYDLPEQKYMMSLLEPSIISFSQLLHKLISDANYKSKNYLYLVEQVDSENLDYLYYAIFRTLDEGFPHCLYCDRLFANAHNYCIHLNTREHLNKFSSYQVHFENGNLFESAHEAVQYILFEKAKRYWDKETRNCIEPPMFLSLLNREFAHFYCSSCDIPFLDFDFFIAHFWSRSHLAKEPIRAIEPAFIAEMIERATDEQLSRISDEILEKYSPRKSRRFVYSDQFESNRNEYFGHYIRFHYEKEHERWMDRMQKFEQVKGKPVDFHSDIHAPNLDMVVEIDNVMRARHKKAPFSWWDQTSEDWTQFRNFYFTYPPLSMWKNLNRDFEKKRKIPYCIICELEFDRVEDFYLHFGEGYHPFPLSMDEDEFLAGYRMLIYIMYYERREFRLSEYVSVVINYLPSSRSDDQLSP